MSVTMKEVAAAAGVSIGTVDRVLNNRGKVKEATQRRVEGAIAQLGYTSDPLARGLVKRRNPTKIGVVINDPALNYYAFEVKRGVDAAALELAKFGLEVKCFFIDRITGSKLAQTLDDIYEHEDVSGLILKPINQPLIQQRIDRFVARGIPVVTCASDIDNTHRTCFVGHDRIAEGRIAANLLTKMVRKDANIAVITGSLDILGHQRTSGGFCDYIVERLPAAQILGVFETYDSRDSTEDILKILTANHRVDALCVQSIGTRGIQSLRRFYTLENKPVICTFGCGAEQEALLKEGWIDFAILERPFKHGNIAVRVLFDLLNGRPPASPFVEIETKILVGECLRP